MQDIRFLQLLQLTDSAIPIGSTAHSFGLETLVAEGYLTVERLSSFLHDYLQEASLLESSFCRLGHRLATVPAQDIFEVRWLALNDQLSAYKMARESRIASSTLGRRLLQLVQGLEPHPCITYALQSAKQAGRDTHYSSTFGLLGGILDIHEDNTTLAYLQQSLTSLISACQRLLPLGQTQASSILWQLKPTLVEIARQSEKVARHAEDIAVFTPLLDVGSMRHPTITTRLFIS